MGISGIADDGLGSCRHDRVYVGVPRDDKGCSGGIVKFCIFKFCIVVLKEGEAYVANQAGDREGLEVCGRNTGDLAVVPRAARRHSP